MKLSLALLVTVVTLGQIATASYTRNAGQSVATFLEFPATQYGSSQFAKVDFQIVPPKDAAGLNVASLGSSGHKDFVLDAGKTTYALQPDGSVKGTYTAAMGTHAGKALQLVWVCQRQATNQSFTLIATAYDSNGAKVDLDIGTPDTITVRAQNPVARVSLGNQQ